MRLLLTVEGTFMITGRFFIVVPGPVLDEVHGPGDIVVDLRRPDGSAASAMMHLGLAFVTPPPPVRTWVCMFKTLEKADVPIGTEIWCDDEVFVSGREHS